MMLGGFQSWLTIWILILLICAAATSTPMPSRHAAPPPPLSKEVLSLTLLWKCYPNHDWKVSFLSSTWNPISWKMTFCPLTKRPHHFRICGGKGPTYRIMPWLEKSFYFCLILSDLDHYNSICQAQDLDHGRRKKKVRHMKIRGKQLLMNPSKNRCECLKTPWCCLSSLHSSLIPAYALAKAS